MSKIKREAGLETIPNDNSNGRAPVTASSSQPVTSQANHFSSSTLPMPIPSPQPPNGWQLPSFQEHMQSRQDDLFPLSTFGSTSLQPIQTALGSHYDSARLPQSGTSAGSYAETEFHSPLEYPHTPGSLTFSEQLPPPVSSSYHEDSLSRVTSNSYSMHDASVDSYSNQPAADMHQDQPANDFASEDTMDPNQTQLSSLESMLFDSNGMSFDPFDPFGSELQEADDNEQKDMMLVDTRFNNPFFHLSPRLQSLMEYYDRNVCPYLVAFDGPENPYRRHILQLAINNEGLQNAIAALATNNLRMRKKEQKSIGYVEEIADAFDGPQIKDPNDASPEESMYKQMSIDQLNMQLTDMRAAQDDSVLATLLILCLFHVCDSGFSKFKTQLAGVQKLLSLRNPTVQSGFTGWVEMFFTWFDVMTSTVNDREMQIKGESLDMLDYSANLGALEQFSGCDGRLFKLIARLGRLNLLAQGRTVRVNSEYDQRTPRLSAVKRPRTRSGRKHRPSAKARANRSLSALDYENMDGNGWGTPIISEDEDADASADEDTEILPDERREFWAEWNDVRQRLQAWEMDSNMASPSPQTPMDAMQQDQGQRDLVHINESFRFAALLYTERLGHPVLQSSHTQFQSLVSQALYHITALPVTSCVNKFLLWPLFITGTECVDAGHRNIIRQRCVEVQKESGFFNNISSLEVLEKVWREIGNNVKGREGEEVKARRRDSEASTRGRFGQAFRWRKAMDRVDGEYIVI